MQKPREHWSSHLGFILAAAGSAIGLGTLWQVPYITGENGGGAFVLVYFLCTLLIGVPVFIGELIIGRRSQRSAVAAFDTLSNNSPFWKTAGWLGVLSSFLIMSFYSVIAGWGMNYVFMCLNQFYHGKDAQEIGAIFELLERSWDITLFWQLAFIGLTISVVYLGIRGGIEYWSKFMMLTLFVMLMGLTLYSFTLPGVGDALTFLFYPDWSQFKAHSALSALGLSFFTLSVAQGVMITYGSYMKKAEDIPQTGLIIGAMIIFVAALAGMMIFPVIFTYNFIPDQGPGLVFKTLPLLFGKLPGALLISTTFFLLFVFAALTSSIAMVEVIVANFMDLLNWSRPKAVLVTGIACFLFGIPSALSKTGLLFANWEALYGYSFFDTVSRLVNQWTMPVGGLLTALFVGWVLDKEAAREEFGSGSSMAYLFKPWHFFLKWVSPIAILLILLQSLGVTQLFEKG